MRFVFYVVSQLAGAQALRVAVHQEYLVARRSQRPQEKHPEMRHEIVGDFVIGIVKQYVHSDHSDKSELLVADLTRPHAYATSPVIKKSDETLVCTQP